jgi:hypothetical protein
MSSRPVNQEPEDPDYLGSIAQHFIEKEPVEVPRPGIDTVIKDFRDVCPSMEFAFLSGDVCWAMRSVCDHGSWMKFSATREDFAETLLALYAVTEGTHKEDD